MSDRKTRLLEKALSWMKKGDSDKIAALKHMLPASDRTIFNVDELSALNPYAVEQRYPGTAIVCAKHNASDALQWVETIRAAVRQIIGHG